jgi:hypothetical protein
MNSIINGRDSDQGNYEPLVPPKWRALNPVDRSQIGLVPNYAYYDDNRNVVIVVKQSSNGVGFAISKGGVDHFKPLLARQRITSCAVRLIDHNSSVVGECGLESLLPTLERAAVNVSAYYDSTYWWLNRDFSVSPIGGGSRTEGSPAWLQLPETIQTDM